MRFVERFTWYLTNKYPKELELMNTNSNGYSLQAKRTHFPAAHEASMSDMMSTFSSASVGEVDADMTDEDTASEEWRTKNGAAVRRER
jgi:hypothetical protein